MKSSELAALDKEKEKFKIYLIQAGLKLSRARKSVFEEVIRIHGHFTAEELAKSCYKNSKISRASVYRALRELLESGIIRETAFGDKHRHFEHLYDEKPHHHAQCLRCHKFIEFPDKKEDEVYHPYLEKQGFKILGHEMHFYGICKQCQNTEHLSTS
jgi:Fur family ferric uptake transcriptional regulator